MQLANTPRWKANISGEYSQPVGMLEGFVAADVVYRSNLRFSAVVDPAAALDATTTVGARVGLRTEDRRLGASVFVRNAFDERIPVGLGFGTAFSTPASTASNQTFAVSSFRLIGISLDARF